MPRCRFLFAAEFGDPISSIFMNENGCMAGTMMGRVWIYSFESKQVEMLTTFSDEGVRGLYADHEFSYAILNEGCRIWSFENLQERGTVDFSSLDKKNTHNVKYVLQRGPLACVLFPVSTTVVNVAQQGHYYHSGFKLFDFGSSTEVVPCDFDGETLAVVDRCQAGGNPVFRVVQLARYDVTEIDCLPRASNISLVKLWGPDCFAYAVGNTLYLYDYKKKETRHKLHGHHAEIVAVDARDTVILGTLSSDAVVKLWSGKRGDCLQTLFVPEASFFLGVPYELCVQGKRILVSADQGVYLLEADAMVTKV